MITVIKFTNKGIWCDYNMTKLQVEVIDLINKKKFYLAFSKSSKLFGKMSNIISNYKPGFIAVVQYNKDWNNRVKIINKREYNIKYAQYLI
jgi:hypothetical protein